MKLILRIVFNSLTNKEIFIENPSYIPALGEIVNFNPEDFFEDTNEIETLRQYSEKGIWKASYKTVNYTKETVTVLIALEEEY